MRVIAPEADEDHVRVIRASRCNDASDEHEGSCKIFLKKVKKMFDIYYYIYYTIYEVKEREGK